jgi:Tol biopolymer transport system component
VALAPGTRIGVYEIVGPLGAGGMGEVYRATDTRLGRAVALKTLPPEFALDPDRQLRFEREAKTLATLNHSYIAQIYGLEVLSAEDGAPATPALAMELVEGEDLARRIARGPMPLDEAIPLARQIAEALEAAHEAGIVHRDLKPANIRVTPDGSVKVLDFGLAKPVEASGGIAAGASQSPTILTSPAMTLHGVILGTAGYMAPEQARGRPVDRRADIWAFGWVLYELLTGRRAFDGDDVTEILAAIVKSEPDWTKLPAATPARIRTLLQRCLAKDRNQRLQHIGDARLDLADPELGRAGDGPIGRFSRALWLWALAGAATASLGLAAWDMLRPPPPTPSATTVRALLDIPADEGSERPEVSPDGLRVAYEAAGPMGARGIWVRELAQDRSSFVAGTDGGTAPFWSPDSSQIAFFADDRLKAVALAGGPARTICDAQTTGRNSGAWHQRGLILFSEDVRRPIFQVSAEGGQPEAVTIVPDAEGAADSATVGDYNPRFLPDGDHFLFFRKRESWGLHVGSLSQKTAVELMASLTGAEFVAPSWVLWVGEDGTLSARRFNGATLAFEGVATVLANGVDFLATAYRPMVSAAGDVVVWRTAREAVNRLAVVDRSGRERRQIGEPAAYGDPQVSADGRRLAVELTTSRAANRKQVAIFALDSGGPPVSLASGALDEGQATPSSDGRRLVFASRPRGFPDTPAFWLRDLTKSGAGEALRLRGVIDDWTGDGRHIVTTQLTGNGQRTMWAITPPDGSPMSLAPGGGDMSQGQVSPNGRWLAFVSQDSAGRASVYVQGFPTPGARHLVSPRGGTRARWSSDGRELFYRASDNTIYAVPVSTDDDLTVGDAQPLFRLPLAQPNGAGIGQAAQFDVLPDGQFVVNLEVQPFSASFHVMTNWQALLK